MPGNETYLLRGQRQATKIARTPIINIDNGSGTTADYVLLYCTFPIYIDVARVVYDTETAGTIAAATVSVGTTVGGVDVVAAVALTNSKTVGSVTALTLAKNLIPATTMLVVRHTGLATTVAGEYWVEIEYRIQD